MLLWLVYSQCCLLNTSAGSVYWLQCCRLCDEMFHSQIEHREQNHFPRLLDVPYGMWTCGLNLKVHSLLAIVLVKNTVLKSPLMNLLKLFSWIVFAIIFFVFKVFFFHVLLRNKIFWSCQSLEDLKNIMKHLECLFSSPLPVLLFLYRFLLAPICWLLLPLSHLLPCLPPLLPRRLVSPWLLLLISSPWVVFVRAVRTEVNTSKTPLSFGALTLHRPPDCVCQGKERWIKTVCYSTRYCKWWQYVPIGYLCQSHFTATWSVGL